MAKRMAVLVAAALLCAGQAGCGGNHPGSTEVNATPVPTTSVQPSTTASTVSVAVLDQHVLAILNAGNATIAADKAKPGDTGFPGVQAAFNNTAQQLQGLTYPSASQADAKTLVAILEKLSADVGQVIASPNTTEEQNIENDEGTELADSDALRHDLGLPASPGV